MECGEPTTLRVTVTAAGHRPGEQDVLLRPDAPWPVVEFRLDRAAVREEPAMSAGRLPDGVGAGGLLSAWWRIREHDALNTAVCRGAPVAAGGHADSWTVVAADGSFRLPVGWERRALCLQRPGSPAQWFVPRATADGVALESLPHGSIVGRVTGMPPAARGFTYVVLFTRGLLRRTARVALDGTFEFAGVPAVTCWLRAGDDDFDRVRNRLRSRLGLDDNRTLARPSEGAVTVTVRAGETTEGIEVPFEP